MFRILFIVGSTVLLAAACLAQQAAGTAAKKAGAPAVETAARPAGNVAAAQAAPPPSALKVADVVKMLDAKMSESIILAKVRQNNKAFDLSADQMVQLKTSGASDDLVMIMMDPTATPAPTPATPKPDVRSEAAPPPPPLAPAVAKAKKTVAIANFSWDAVRGSWYSAFGSEDQIGKGIRDRLTTRIVQNKQLMVLEREDLQRLLDEQNRNMSERFLPGQGPRLSRIVGADTYLLGAVTIFGRDDQAKGFLGGIRLPGPIDVTKIWKKQEKAVVAIDYRLVNAETGTIVAAGTARGESSRTSRSWGDMVHVPGVTAAGGTSVQSTNFEQTIIGEATMDCVEKLAKLLTDSASELGGRSTAEVDTRIADVDGNVVTIVAGADQGLQVGQVLDVAQNLGDIRDPNTGESKGVKTRAIGTLVITKVDRQTATGTFTGSVAPKVNDIARSQ